MKIIFNEKLVNRNARIGQITSIAGLLVLAGGLYISFAQPEQVYISIGALVLGFILSQVGIFFGNRFGRRPRPDEHLNAGLKGIDSAHTIYHYASPTSHLLVGPSGVWVLLPRYQNGTIRYDSKRNRWQQKGGNFLAAYMRVFGQEGLGRPDLDIAAEVEAVEKYLTKKLPEGTLPEIQAVLVFTNDKVAIEADEAPVPTVPIKKLKDVIRKAGKGKLSPARLQQINEAFGGV